jgi:hypothetical protein
VKLTWFTGLLVLLMGAVIGTLLGQIVGMLLPSGPMHDLFFTGASIGLEKPLELNLAVLKVVFGITLSVNPVTLLGLLLGVYLVLKFKK